MSPAIREWDPPNVQWVVKVSKHCNLRCKYCYEYPHLADTRHLSISQLRRIFLHIAQFYEDRPRLMEVVWHGGEPLLLPASFYDEVAAIQHEAFRGTGVRCENAVQTNLVHLTDAHIDLFGRFFKQVGVSLDLFGNERINVAGHATEPSVIRNMQRLQQRGINFGCITVLSRLTAPHVISVYKFYENIHTSFRLLPIYRTGYERQHDERMLSIEELVRCLKIATDYWFNSDSDIVVQPLQDYISIAVRHINRSSTVLSKYDKAKNQIVNIVDTDGKLYSNADAYAPDLAHGNLIEESLSEMRANDGYRLSLSRSQQRMAVCDDCPYFGSCSGFFMAEATPEQLHYVHDKLVCAVARPMIEYVLGKFQASNLDHMLRTRALKQ